MVLFAQSWHQLYMADKLEFGIVVYPWADSAPEVQSPVEPVYMMSWTRLFTSR